MNLNMSYPLLNRVGGFFLCEQVLINVFALEHGFPGWKQKLFALAGAKYDKKAKKKGVQYRFIFVRSDGEQLERITKIIEDYKIEPAVDPTEFHIEDIDKALNLVAQGHTKGKVVIKF